MICGVEELKMSFVGVEIEKGEREGDGSNDAESVCR